MVIRDGNYKTNNHRDKYQTHSSAVLERILKNVQEGCELSGRLIFSDMNFILK